MLIGLFGGIAVYQVVEEVVDYAMLGWLGTYWGFKLSLERLPHVGLVLGKLIFLVTQFLACYYYRSLLFK
jgi:hypothetical protein